MKKKENDPFSYLFKQFSSLEFKEHETIQQLIRNYYPLNKNEEIYINNITIKDKNQFIRQIKKILRELSISMETIEYIFNEYYHFITMNKKENPFGKLQKSEIINKLGISSNMYNKIMNLFNSIVLALNDTKYNGINDEMKIENEEEKKNENVKEKKKNVKDNIENINILSQEMKFVFTEYNKNKKDTNYKENEDNKVNNIKIQTSISLTQDEEEKLKKELESYAMNF